MAVCVGFLTIILPLIYIGSRYNHAPPSGVFARTGFSSRTRKSCHFRTRPVMQRSVPANSLPRLGDFTTDRRVLVLTAMAILVGAGGTITAWILLRMIALTSNLVWLQTFSVHSLPLENVKPSLWMVAAPALGGLVIGL